MHLWKTFDPANRAEPFDDTWLRFPMCGSDRQRQIQQLRHSEPTASRGDGVLRKFVLPQRMTDRMSTGDDDLKVWSKEIYPDWKPSIAVVQSGPLTENLVFEPEETGCVTKRTKAKLDATTFLSSKETICEMYPGISARMYVYSGHIFMYAYVFVVYAVILYICTVIILLCIYNILCLALRF